MTIHARISCLCIAGERGAVTRSPPGAVPGIVEPTVHVERPFDFKKQPRGQQRLVFEPSPDRRRPGLVPLDGMELQPVPPASSGFVAQLLGQGSEREDLRGLRGHLQGPELGSHAYRRAGGSPALYPEGAALLRLAI